MFEIKGFHFYKYLSSSFSSFDAHRRFCLSQVKSDFVVLDLDFASDRTSRVLNNFARTIYYVMSKKGRRFTLAKLYLETTTSVNLLK